MIAYLGLGLISLPWKLFETWYKKPKRMDQYELKVLQTKVETNTLLLIKKAKELKDKKFEIDFNSTFLTRKFKNIAFNSNLSAF